ncbi:hypothetical protein [Rappaport israeli]|uniref:hypothetical protein n=1 Tax=Rappaport israeli TaxID=1839807 RepID=UPI00092FF1FA|nr:hypothetical protein [Rappaport israeli]
MPKTILNSAILTALFTLTTVSTQAAINMKPEAKQALISQRLEHIDMQTKEYIDQVLKQDASIESIDLVVGKLDFNPTNQTAQSMDQLTIRLRGDEQAVEPIVIYANNHIDYSDALNQQDILARIDTEISLSDEQIKMLGEIENDNEVILYLKNLNKNLTVRTDLLADKQFKQYIALAPFTSEEAEGGKIVFEGLEVDTQAHDDTFIRGVGKTHFAMHKLLVERLKTVIDYDALAQLTTEQQKALDEYPKIDSVETVLVLEPFTVDYELTEKGKLSLNSSPISLASPFKGFTLNIENISGEGKLKYEEALDQHIGKSHFVVKDLTIFSDEKLKEALKIDSVTFDRDVQKNGKLYSEMGKFVVKADSKSFNQLTDNKFQFKGIDFDYKVSNFSKNLLESVTNLGQLYNQGQHAWSEGNCQAMLEIVDDLVKNNTSLAETFAVRTDKGDAYLKIEASLRKGADTKAWANACKASDDAQWKQLLDKDVFYYAEIKVPVALTDASDLSYMVEMMGAPYVEKKGDVFSVVVENKGQGMLVNGKPLTENSAH